jgi:ferredoxin
MAGLSGPTPTHNRGEGEMKVAIIEEACTGCEECVIAVPEVFTLNASTYIAELATDTIPDEKMDDVKKAAAGCAAKAIEIS